MSPENLVSYFRGEVEEEVHFGSLIHLNRNGIINSIGDVENKIYFYRSSLKPIQASFLIDFDIVNKINLNSQEIAISCGSQSGSLEQVEILKNYLLKTNCDEKDLKCGVHFPLDSFENIRLKSENLSCQVFHHNCCGKHIGMLAVCKQNGWDISSYNKQEHILQKLLLEKIKNLSEFNDVKIALDGCNLPTFGLPLKNMALSFLNFFSDEKYDIIKKSIQKNYFIFGGNNRQDSLIISANEDLIAKVGAAGLMMIYNDKNQEVLIVKMLDGNENARLIVTLEAMCMIGFINETQKNNLIEKCKINKLFSTSTSQKTGKYEIKFLLKPNN